MSSTQSPILTLDVAHPPRHPDIVEQELLDAWSRVRNSSLLRILKIVHGHGSLGKGGATKETVRNWAFRHRMKFKAVIDGESYSIYVDGTREMRTEVGSYEDADLENANAGITLLWIK